MDDEQHNVNILSQMLIKNHPEIEITGTANSAEEARSLIHQVKPDLVFLDVKMPVENGFDLLESLSEINFEVVFVTAFDKYALKAIKFCAIDYLLKPIAPKDLETALSRVRQVFHERNQNKRLMHLLDNLKSDARPQKIALPTANELHFVEVDKIIRCQAENNYTHFYLDNGCSVLVSKTLKEWDELLSDYGFIRTHQSHLINKQYVKAYVKKEGGYLAMMDGSQVSISKQRKEGVLESIMSQ